MPAPRVAVLMPLYNDDRCVRDAIDSVLAQTFTDFELLIVDDGSTDSSASIAASYGDPRIRLVSNETNLGLTKSLNRGLELIGSEYVARLDANDIAYPERLAKQVAWLDAHPEVGALGVQAIPIDVRGRRIRRIPLWSRQWRRPVGGAWMDWYRIFDTPLVHSGTMFRGDVVRSLGGYDSRHPLEQDAELWMRLARKWRLANLDIPLVAFRQDRRSMTLDPGRPERDGYLERKSAIVHTIMQEQLRFADVPRRWAELWVRANLPRTKLTHDELAELASALDECARRFFLLHPEARDDREIARHRASMTARLIDKSGLKEIPRLYRRMLGEDVVSALLLLPRIFVLSLIRSRRRS